MWQDFALTIIGAIFTISLIPQLIDVYRNGVMNSMTCFITSIGCFIIAYIDLTLSLPLSAAMSFITAIIWGLMFCYSRPLLKIGVNGYFKE